MGIFNFFKKAKIEPTENKRREAPATKSPEKILSVKDTPIPEEIALPPLGPFISEYFIHTTSKIEEYLLSIVEIHDGDSLIDFHTAIERYYNDPKVYFPWEFHFKTVRIEQNGNDWIVYGDEHEVGRIPTLGKDELDHLTISEIMEKFTIDHLDCDIRLDKYFRLSEAQYKQFVKEDKYNRGFASWTKRPQAKLIVYYK